MLIYRDYRTTLQLARIPLTPTPMLENKNWYYWTTLSIGQIINAYTNQLSGCWLKPKTPRPICNEPEVVWCNNWRRTCTRRRVATMTSSSIFKPEPVVVIKPLMWWIQFNLSAQHQRCRCWRHRWQHGYIRGPVWKLIPQFALDIGDYS